MKSPCPASFETAPSIRCLLNRIESKCHDAALITDVCKPGNDEYSRFACRTRPSGTGCDHPMKRRLQPLFFGLLALFRSAILHAAAGEYDLIIRHGKIVDGSGNPWFYGDVAVKGDRILAIGRVEGDAKRGIDATALVVAPGFIDMHSHSDWTLLEDGNAQSKIRQGVTTEVIGESTSAGPFKGKLKPQTVSVKNEPLEIRALRDYFAAIERAGVSVNVASYVGEGTVW